MMGSGKIDVKPLITDTFGFATASRRSTSPPLAPAGEREVQIAMPQ